jgi:hypothetical protein
MQDVQRYDLTAEKFLPHEALGVLTSLFCLHSRNPQGPYTANYKTARDLYLAPPNGPPLLQSTRGTWQDRRESSITERKYDLTDTNLPPDHVKFYSPIGPKLSSSFCFRTSPKWLFMFLLLLSIYMNF